MKSRAWHTTNDYSEMMLDRDNEWKGIHTTVNGHNQYHVTFRIKGLYERERERGRG